MNDREVTLNEQIATEVHKARRARGWTQADLAELSSTSQGAIALIEAGKGNPTLETINRILHALGKRGNIRFMPALSPSNEPEHPSNQPQS
jgi:y4mF family transcriptional regulator